MSDARRSPPEDEVPFKLEVSRESYNDARRARGSLKRAAFLVLWVAGPLSAIFSILAVLGLIPGGASADPKQQPPASQSVDMSNSRNSGAQSVSGPAINQSGGSHNNANTGNQTNVGNTNNTINSSGGQGNNQSVNIVGSVSPGASIRGGDVHNYNGLDVDAIERLRRTDIDKLTPQQVLKRYIDPFSERMPDQPNVALHMLPIQGHEVTALEDAASSALIDLGYHVPTLFRKHFTSDELDKELFRGSTKLAKQLRLQDYCDGVLLGEVRLNPSSNLDGLFITEATMSLHQIAVDSGAIAQNLVIRAKGSGLNADTSAASALRELEESLKQRLAEWRLI